MEIRVLGVLSVRLRDGTAVPPEVWGTSKTRHLLRILAMNAETPVPTDRLLEALWPAVDLVRGRGSLRTAASRIRKVIGKEGVVRQFDGLVLRHAWVDAVAFASRAEEARRLFAAGDLTGGLAVADGALALYGGDLCADEPYADWALVDRDHLRGVRATLLTDAAEAALALARYRRAIELAGQVVDGDPAAERAYRVLMRAHVAVGEMDKTVRAYVCLCDALAAELGATPSQATRALYAELVAAQQTTLRKRWCAQRGRSRSRSWSRCSAR